MERTPGTGQTAVPGFFKLLASNPKRRSRSTASEPPGLPLKASPVSRRCPYHFIRTAARVHHAARRRCRGVAARGARSSLPNCVESECSWI